MSIPSRHSHPPAIHGRLGFNGEYQERSGLQILGSYRAYNPCLMRFHGADNLSPFRRGGLNAYAYCLGDPVNLIDPTGHLPWLLWRVLTPARIAMVPAALAVGTLVGALAAPNDDIKRPLMPMAILFGGLAGATAAAPYILKNLSRSRYLALRDKWRERARLPPLHRDSATRSTLEGQRRSSTPAPDTPNDRPPGYDEAVRQRAPAPLPDELPPPYQATLDPAPPFDAPFLRPGVLLQALPASRQSLAARAADIRRG